MFDRAHRPVVGIVKTRRMREAAGETRRNRARKRRGRAAERIHHASDLGRDDDLVSRDVTKPGAHARFGEAIAIMGRGIEGANAALVGLLDGGDRRLFIENVEEVAERTHAEADRRKRKVGPVASLEATHFHRSLPCPADVPRGRRSTLILSLSRARARQGAARLAPAPPYAAGLSILRSTISTPSSSNMPNRRNPTASEQRSAAALPRSWAI